MTEKKHSIKVKQTSQGVSYLTFAEWLNYFVHTEFSQEVSVSELIQTLSKKPGIAFSYPMVESVKAITE